MALFSLVDKFSETFKYLKWHLLCRNWCTVPHTTRCFDEFFYFSRCLTYIQLCIRFLFMYYLSFMFILIRGILIISMYMYIIMGIYFHYYLCAHNYFYQRHHEFFLCLLSLPWVL